MCVGVIFPPFAFQKMSTAVFVADSPPCCSVTQVAEAALVDVETIFADFGVTSGFCVVPVHVVLNFDVVTRLPGCATSVNGGETFAFPETRAPQRAQPTPR